MSDILFQRVAIIGLGQMGASLGLSLKHGGRVGTIAGYDLHPDHSATALSVEAIDILAATPEEAVAKADLVILCTPVGCYGPVMETIAPHLKEGCVLTDIGSIKKQAIEDITPHLPDHVAYVPSHPIAGSEKVGPYTARGDYFVDHLFLITPPSQEYIEAIEPVGQLWQSLGSVVDVLPADSHDQIYAYMSHIPQLMCYAAMPVLDEHGIKPQENDALYERFIRIGRSDPEMWRDVFVENAQNVLGAAAGVRSVLEHMRDELKSGVESAEIKEPDAEMMAHIAKTAWSRMLASALIITVKMIEEQGGASLGRYAAGGFTDFTASAVEEPEHDLALISDYAEAVIELIDQYLLQQDRIVHFIQDEDAAHLLGALALCQACGKRLVTTQH
ncbi:MAG: prephenate dehydrogenase/arogenate dehydrogenase family protein [Rickettsiales bacterium]|nr:prephenate dehydrogenase/arogenate dehydrogenase family protein [Rickettsiales bacterium]